MNYETRNEPETGAYQHTVGQKEFVGAMDKFSQSRIVRSIAGLATGLTAWAAFGHSQPAEAQSSGYTDEQGRGFDEYTLEGQCTDGDAFLHSEFSPTDPAEVAHMRDQSGEEDTILLRQTAAPDDTRTRTIPWESFFEKETIRVYMAANFDYEEDRMWENDSEIVDGPLREIEYPCNDGGTGGPERHVDTETLTGAHRYETAVEISQEHYDQAGTAVIATGEGYADALAGSALAASTRGPVLLNEHGELRNDVDNELDRLGVDHVYILGGEAAISGHVENQLGARGVEVDRLGGVTRYETARLIAEEVDKHEVNVMENETETDTAETPGDNGKNVFLTTGEGFPDALSTSHPAADREEPILLSPSDSLSEAPKEYLEESHQEVDRITVVGGQAAVSAAAENEAATAGDAESQRWAGSTRYWTSAEAARQSQDGEVENIYIATGSDYPDALAHGTASATQENSAFLLVPGHNAQALSHVENFAQDHGQQVRRVIFAGGSAAISGEVKNGVTTIFDAYTEVE